LFIPVDGTPNDDTMLRSVTNLSPDFFATRKIRRHRLRATATVQVNLALWLFLCIDLSLIAKTRAFFENAEIESFPLWRHFTGIPPKRYFAKQKKQPVFLAFPVRKNFLAVYSYDFFCAPRCSVVRCAVRGASIEAVMRCWELE
jgi:hypothetical protein